MQRVGVWGSSKWELECTRGREWGVASGSVADLISRQLLFGGHLST